MNIRFYPDSWETVDKMTHPLEGLVTEIKNQIKIQKNVSIIIDKETIEKMRKSLLDSHKKAIARGGVGGIDPLLKDFETKKYTIREDANWIRAYVKRKIVDHKLKYITGGTEIHIMTDAENE